MGKVLQLAISLSFVGILSACATGGGMQSGGATANSGGSQPYNEREAVEYKSAILRCHKTGGSRVVQIEGQLRCF